MRNLPQIIAHAKSDVDRATSTLSKLVREGTKYTLDFEQTRIKLIQVSEILADVHRLAFHDPDPMQFDLGFDIPQAKDET